MENRMSKKQLLIFCSFVIITFSNAKFFINRELDDPVAYLGYLLLLCGIITSYLKLPNAYKIGININLAITFPFFSIGILLQPMGLSLKIRLLLTMLIIALSALASDGLMQSFEDMRIGAYGLLTGEMLVLLLSLFTKTRVFSNVDEPMGLLALGFDAGMSHKNYFAMILMASFSVVYMYRKYAQKKLVDLIVLFMEGFLLFLSHARAVWLLTIMFLLIMFMDKIKVNIKLNKLLMLIGFSVFFVATIVAVLWIYQNVLKRSGTYVSRISGFTSYWFMYCENDTFHRIFGNAATFFGTDNYSDNFRKLMNYDGAVDMAILNILIKNGLMGLVGYFFVFGRIIKQAIQTNSRNLRVCSFAIVLPMIVSMFSENCVSTISLSYAPFCYTVLASLYWQMNFKVDDVIVCNDKLWRSI